MYGRQLCFDTHPFYTPLWSGVLICRILDLRKCQVLWNTEVLLGVLVEEVREMSLEHLDTFVSSKIVREVVIALPCDEVGKALEHHVLVGRHQRLLALPAYVEVVQSGLRCRILHGLGHARRYLMSSSLVLNCLVAYVGISYVHLGLLRLGLVDAPVHRAGSLHDTVVYFIVLLRAKSLPQAHDCSHALLEPQLLDLRLLLLSQLVLGVCKSAVLVRFQLARVVIAIGLLGRLLFAAAVVVHIILPIN